MKRALCVSVIGVACALGACNKDESAAGPDPSIDGVSRIQLPPVDTSILDDQKVAFDQKKASGASAAPAPAAPASAPASASAPATAPAASAPAPAAGAQQG